MARCGDTATVTHMARIPSRDLRNHTAQVLRRVADGDTVTVTVNGEPVAEITKPRAARRPFMTRADVVLLHRRQGPDPTLAKDLTWISAGTTDDLGPVR